MIFFIPAWRDLLLQGMATDDMIGPVKSFMKSKQDYQVLISDYLPELRYFLHRYGLLECQYISLFDELQSVEDDNQRVVKLRDLNFSDSAYFLPSPFCFLVYEQKRLVGKVFVGSGSQILEVHYLTRGVLQTIEWYDDRGFLSSRNFFEDGKPLLVEYLDFQGQWVIRESIQTGRCEINPANAKFLQHRDYQSLEEIKFEFINKKLRRMPGRSGVMVSVTNKNVLFILKSPFLSKITLSFFRSRAHQVDNKENHIQDLINDANATIVDSISQAERLECYCKIDKQPLQISPYDTRFELSRSQELKEEVVYVEVRGISNEDSQVLLSILIDYLIQRLSQKNISREFRVIFRVAHNAQFTFLNDAIQNCLQSRFSEENLPTFVPNTTALQENEVDEGIEEAECPNRILAQKLRKSVDVRIIKSETEIFELISKTRLIVDLSNVPDLLTQVAGISAGIPQINSRANEYVRHQENGWIIKKVEELEDALTYYLEDMQHWQEARVSAVKQIKKYSGGELMRRISRIIGEKMDG